MRALGASTFAATAVWGSRAVIESDDPAICGTPSASVIWVMVTGGGATNGWAEVGYGRFGQDWGHAGYQVFSQWTTCDTCSPFTVLTQTAPGSGTHTYETQYNNATGRITMKKDGATVDVTSAGWDPKDAWATPWSPQFFAESHYPQSDIPGVSSDHVSVTQIKKLNAGGSASNITTLAAADVGGSPTCWHESTGNLPTSFAVWTDPLTRPCP